MLTLFLAMLDDESDRALFLKLHDKYCLFVFHIAKQFLRDDTVAEEVASDVWFEIATHIKELSIADDESSRNLFYTITKNLSQTAYSKNEKRIKPVSLGEDFPDDSPPIDDVLLSEEKQVRILKMLKCMGEDIRDIMILRFSLGKSPREISRLLSIPTSTVYKMIKRGIKNLKRMIKEDDYFE